MWLLERPKIVNKQHLEALQKITADVVELMDPNLGDQEMPTLSVEIINKEG